MKYLAPLVTCLPMASTAPSALATEGGGSTYPSGVENFLVGAAPPPGFYVLGYGNVYSADKLKDDSGNSIPIPGFKVRAFAASPRFIWSTPYQMMGGNLVFHAIVPVIDLKVEAGGASQHKTGLGDITLGAFGLSTHYSPHLHSVLGLDIVVPTGKYSKGDLANIGRNYLSIQPLYTMSWFDPEGLNGDFKATLNLNRRNGDTQYKSGDELFVDYSAGWGFGNGFTLGAGGYLRTQLNDDKLNGATVANSRARAFAIGPSVKFDNGKGWFITAKYQVENSVKNTVQGKAFWIKSSVPF
jgi:hypothetical protein